MIQLIIGPPGTGKSYLLNEMSQKVEDPIILAPTWYCARKINGKTLYNYCNSSYIKFVPKKFNSNFVFIDEIFMFSKKEMNRVLQCANEDTNFYLFGDPFQIKPPNEDEGYFWEALNKEYKIIYLTKYYRSSEDKKLQEILNNYRITKKIQITNMFQLIPLQKVPELNITVLVGTHQMKESIQKTITNYHIKKGNIIYGPDGKPYRFGQTIFSISQYGTIQEKLQFIKFDNESNMVVKKDNKTFFIEPKRKQNISYQIIPGDVLTINIAQGQEFDKIILDSASFFEFGSLYTGLSRTRFLKDIYVIERKDYDKVFEADLQNVFCK